MANFIMWDTPAMDSRTLKRHKILARLKKLELRRLRLQTMSMLRPKFIGSKPELVIDVKLATFTRIGKIREPAIF